MKISIIFMLTSRMSSQTIKMMAPSLRASEIAYFAFCYLSSSLGFSVLTRSQSIIRGSIEPTSLIRNTPSASFLSLKLAIVMSGTDSLHHLRRSASVLDPIMDRQWMRMSCQTTARVNLRFPSWISYAPIPINLSFIVAHASMATQQLMPILKTLFAFFSTRFHSTAQLSIL